MKALKIVRKVLSSVIFAVVILVLVSLLAVRLFGIQTYIVLSGSMEGVYPTGSLIYVREVDCQTLAVGDPITFRLDAKTVATHRICEIVPDEDDPSSVSYRTKGDENETADGARVRPSAVLGKPFLAVPYLGYAVSYLQRPPGVYIMVTVCVVALIFAFLPSGKARRPSDSDQNAESGS